MITCFTTGPKTWPCAVGLLLLLSCSGRETSTRTDAADSAQTPAATRPRSGNPSDRPGTLTGAASSPVRGTTWRYEKTVDKAGQTVYKASITSPTALTFGFPYAGGSTVTLTIRKRDDQTTVYLQVANGQFNRSFQGGNARIRFDRNPPGTYAYSAAENGSATIIFFDDVPALIDRMKQAGTMTVDVQFSGQGNRQVEFRTAHLIWPHR